MAPWQMTLTFRIKTLWPYPPPPPPPPTHTLLVCHTYALSGAFLYEILIDH